MEEAPVASSVLLLGANDGAYRWSEGDGERIGHPRHQ